MYYDSSSITNRQTTLAYTHYAFFEWGLIFADVLYDSIAEIDFTEADFQVCGQCEIQHHHYSDMSQRFRYGQEGMLVRYLCTDQNLLNSVHNKLSNIYCNHLQEIAIA